jgi:hypothetical protein
MTQLHIFQIKMIGMKNNIFPTFIFYAIPVRRPTCKTNQPAFARKTCQPAAIFHVQKMAGSSSQIIFAPTEEKTHALATKKTIKTYIDSTKLKKFLPPEQTLQTVSVLP